MGDKGSLPRSVMPPWFMRRQKMASAIAPAAIMPFPRHAHPAMRSMRRSSVMDVFYPTIVINVEFGMKADDSSALPIKPPSPPQRRGTLR